MLLLAFFAQIAFAARETSITLDEPLHIASGYACLSTGDYRLVEEHPPLLKMLQAAPLLLADPPLPDPRTVPGWAEGDLITFAQHSIVPYRPMETLVFAARVPTMLVGILLGAVIFRWTRELTRKHSLLPLFALFLFAFDPNMLAHAGVAATDLGAATGIVAAMYTFWRWAEQPTLKRALVAAVVLGLALGVKSTALMLGPVYAGFLLWGWLHRRDRRSYLLQGVLIAAGAFLTLWASYRFEFGPAPGLPFPIPAPSHLLPLLKLRQHMEGGHSAFLMGKNYHHGDWRYFPIAFLLKTPLLTLFLVTATAARIIIMGIRTPHRLKSHALRIAALVALPTFYFTVSLTSSINIGYRHLLPILPFLYIGVAAGNSQVISYKFKSRFTHPILRILFSALLLSYAATTLELFPWHLAYFNIFAGGPEGGYRYLADSNLDWGHTWKALHRYIKDEGITEFGLSQYTINDPHAYGLDYTPLPPWPAAPPVLPQRFSPPSGIYAISVNQLQGLTIALPEMYDYFRKLEPVARIGHAMFVYKIPIRAPIAWVAQCNVPVTPLPPDVVQEGLGIGDEVPRPVFDCSQSWLIPPGSGRYVLSLEYAGASWASAFQGRLAYEQKRPGFTPPFAIYEWDAALPTVPHRTTTPTTIGKVLTFSGYDAAPLRAGQTGVVETWWRIEARPEQPLSLMAHLLRADGTPLAVGDGLGVTVDQWLSGSLLIQRHTFTIPAETPPGHYAFYVGAYTFPDLERLPVTVEGELIGDHLLVGMLEITP